MQPHLREQIARRPRALVLEFEILAGGPVVHQRENFLYLIRCGIADNASASTFSLPSSSRSCVRRGAAGLRKVTPRPDPTVARFVRHDRSADRYAPTVRQS